MALVNNARSPFTTTTLQTASLGVGVEGESSQDFDWGKIYLISLSHGETEQRTLSFLAGRSSLLGEVIAQLH
jgi:hypothetical protein